MVFHEKTDYLFASWKEILCVVCGLSYQIPQVLWYAVHLLLACFIKVIKPGWKAREEGGTRATLLQLSGNLVHTMSTLPDVHKAKESLMSTGMFYAVFFPSV